MSSSRYFASALRSYRHFQAAAEQPSRGPNIELDARGPRTGVLEGLFVLRVLS